MIKDFSFTGSEEIVRIPKQRMMLWMRSNFSTLREMYLKKAVSFLKV